MQHHNVTYVGLCNERLCVYVFARAKGYKGVMIHHAVEFTCSFTFWLTKDQQKINYFID